MTTTKPPAQSEQLTVELRAMFPDIELAHYDILNGQIILHLPDQWIKYFSGDSLTEAMDQVRKWKQEQQQ